MIYSVALSFQSGRANELQFTGIDNYQRIFSDGVVIKAFSNTILFAALLTPMVLFVSFLLADCINNVKSKRTKSFYSVILFFPSITSPVAYAFFFKKLFAANGFINGFISLGFSQVEMNNMLLTPIGSRIAIMIVCIWAWCGYYTILLLSAMQSINPIIYKAARLDGLSNRQLLFKVTMPIIKPVLLLCSVLLSCGIFQLFAEVMIISQGGPEHATITLSYYIYQLCFVYVPRYGYASSIAIVIFILSCLIGLLQLKFGEMDK